MISNGIDLVLINRFKDLINSKTFINNNFTKKEQDYFGNNIETMAGIYAAKEAFLKSLKKGINDYSLKDIEINHDDNKAPYIELKENIKKHYDIHNISLSISHDGEYAIALVTIVY